MGTVPIGADEKFVTAPSVEIEEFLAAVRSNLQPDCENLHIHPRSKNKEFMRKNRLFQGHVHDILRELKVWNYYRTVQKQGCSDAHEFGYKYRGYLEIYLKVSLQEFEDEVWLNVEVISFHDPELAIQYPYAKLKPSKGRRK